MVVGDAAYDFLFGLFALALQASERTLGHACSKPALFFSAAVYDLGFGLFGWSFGHLNLKPVLLLSDAVYDLGLGRFESIFRLWELEACFAS